jgi:RNA-dependent RNA polymerase
MEVFIRNIPYAVDELQLTRALASVLHGPSFHQHIGGAPFNFLVRIFKGKNPRLKQHGGCGILVVPSVAIGSLFIQLVRNQMVSLHGRTLYAQPGRDAAKPEDLALLTEPYQDPAIAEEQQRRHAEIKGKIQLLDLQFCWPCHDGALSIEWETPTELSWALEFDPETRRFSIKSQTGLSVVVTLKNVQNIALDSHACVLWLERPPIFEREKANIQESLNELDELASLFSMFFMAQKAGPTRDRLTTLDESRGNIFAFLRVLRITFGGQFALRDFKSKAKNFGLTIYEENYNISKQRLFDPVIMECFQEWLKEIPFDIAFQIDGLVSRCRFNPKELRKMKREINAAIERYEEVAICDCIRLLEQRKEEDVEGLSARRLFGGILSDLDRDHSRRQLRQSNQSGEIFHCHRVTVTPTSLILSGPLPDETNRVLRRYMDYQSHFIRVEFRDEDRLHLRLDRDVDSPKFLDERIGTILQKGLVIAGRSFDFLAYRRVSFAFIRRPSTKISNKLIVYS